MKRILCIAGFLILLVLISCLSKRAQNLDKPKFNKSFVRAINEQVEDPPCDSLCDQATFLDEPVFDLYLCKVGTYIALYVEDPDNCTNGAIVLGTEITLAPLNKIVGELGDSNYDGNCNEQDVPDFLNCFQGIQSPDFNCFCAFDWDRDNDIDLYDYSFFQRAIGTGNTYWAQENGID